MDKMTLLKTFLAAGVTGGIALSASAQVLIDETFDYADTPAMLANWSGGAATLDAGFGNFAPSAFHPSGTVNSWTGSLSLDPAVSPFVLRADIYDDGTPGMQTVGFRQAGGADPLFEMGHYDFQSGHYNARILFFGGNENWVSVHEAAGAVGWNRWEATFTATGVSLTLDIGIDGNIDATLVSTGTAPNNPFASLRFGGPSNLSGGDGTFYDNISLEVIPEPSTYAAVFGGLALLGAFVYRRRLSVKK